MSEVRFPEVPAPAFVLDVDTVAQQVHAVRNAFTDELGPVDVWYAVKCNPHPALLDAVAAAGAGFEVASTAELHAVLDTGVSSVDVPFTNPVKSPKQVRDAMALGVKSFTVDHPGEVDKVRAAADLLGVESCDVVLRIAVDNGYSTLPLDGKFGVAPVHVEELARYAKTCRVPVSGVSFHVGSQALNPHAWSSALDTAAFAFDVLRDAGHGPDLVDLGGGFPIRYGDEVPSIDAVADAVRRAWARNRSLHGARRAVEPGRFIAGPAGTYRATVIGVVDRGGQRWIHTDIGAYNGPNEAACARDQFSFPTAVQPARSGGDELSIVTGPTCDPTDTLTPPVWLPRDIRVGDVVEVGQAGAYSLTLASSFNGFDPPDVYVSRSGVVEKAGLVA